MLWKHTSVLLVALFFVARALVPIASAAASAQAFADPRDVAEINAIETEVAGETNIDKVMTHYAENAILIDINKPGWYDGKKEIYKAVRPQLAPLQTIKFRINEISVASDGEFACAAMQIHFDATRKDDSILKMSVRQVDAFKKIDGHWRIIQQHLSLPVDQTTSTPIVDSVAIARGPLVWSNQSTPGPRVPLPQAKQEIKNWLVASEIPKGIDEMTGYYGPGEDFLIFDWWSPREVRGHQEVRDYYGPQFDGVRDLEIKIPVVSIDTDGAFGVQVSQQHLRFNMKDGTTKFISFRQSDCVRRVGNKWYSFFEMGSFPVDTKTGKAIMTDTAGSN
jgi:ketosteroid isomerase-like protein